MSIPTSVEYPQNIEDIFEILKKPFFKDNLVHEDNLGTLESDRKKRLDDLYKKFIELSGDRKVEFYNDFIKKCWHYFLLQQQEIKKNHKSNQAKLIKFNIGEQLEILRTFKKFLIIKNILPEPSAPIESPNSINSLLIPWTPIARKSITSSASIKKFSNSSLRRITDNSLNSAYFNSRSEIIMDLYEMKNIHKRYLLKHLELIDLCQNQRITNRLNTHYVDQLGIYENNARENCLNYLLSITNPNSSQNFNLDLGDILPSEHNNRYLEELKKLKARLRVLGYKGGSKKKLDEFLSYEINKISTDIQHQTPTNSSYYPVAGILKNYQKKETKKSFVPTTRGKLQEDLNKIKNIHKRYLLKHLDLIDLYQKKNNELNYEYNEKFHKQENNARENCLNYLLSITNPNSSQNFNLDLGEILPSEHNKRYLEELKKLKARLRVLGYKGGSKKKLDEFLSYEINKISTDIQHQTPTNSSYYPVAGILKNYQKKETKKSFVPTTRGKLQEDLNKIKNIHKRYLLKHLDLIDLYQKKNNELNYEYNEKFHKQENNARENCLNYLLSITNPNSSQNFNLDLGEILPSEHNKRYLEELKKLKARLRVLSYKDGSKERLDEFLSYEIEKVNIDLGKDVINSTRSTHLFNKMLDKWPSSPNLLYKALTNPNSNLNKEAPKETSQSWGDRVRSRSGNGNSNLQTIKSSSRWTR